jgi:HAD superfamily hydrolase (TIGR01459 family)
VTRAISALAEIAGAYDAVFCDVWGVLHDGRAAFPEAVSALQAYRREGGAVILVTNVPKPRGPIPAQLDRLGVPRDCWDAIVTSGDAIRMELAARAPGPMFKIGPAEFDRTLWEGLGLVEAGLSDAAFIGVSGLNEEPGWREPGDYAELLAAARARDLEMLCANPDIVVRVGSQLVWCAGALARDYEAIGGRVVMAGKPHAPIYRLARQEAERLLDRPVRSPLAIGDGIVTDVLGANREALDCLFIAAGIHGDALTTDGALDAEKVERALFADGASAHFAMAGLR